jgi:hypothetical protein
MRWTAEEVALLRELHAAGDLMKAIAAKLGRPHRSIVGKADRLDLPGRKIGRPIIHGRRVRKVKDSDVTHPLPPGARTLPPMASERL